MADVGRLQQAQPIAKREAAKLLARWTGNQHRLVSSSGFDVKPSGTFVTSRFRERTLQIYPKLADDWRYLAFLDLLLFGAFLDNQSRPRKVVTHRAILAALGMPAKTGSRAFQSGRFIGEFNQTVVGGRLLIDPYNYELHQARAIAINNLAREFLDALDDELTTVHQSSASERVGFVTGERWNPAVGCTREDQRREAVRFRGVIPDAQRLIEYLNALPSNIFTSAINGNMQSAVEVASRIVQNANRRHQLALLHRISLQPQPFYGCSGDRKTVRIFARNPSILQLRNEVKQAFTRDWTTFDLRFAQLAIIAKDWGIDDLREVLSDPRRDVWKELAATLAPVTADVAKAAIKKGVYAIAYGANKRTVRRVIEQEVEDWSGDVDIDTRAFFDKPIIKELLLYRKAALYVVRQKEGAPDCFNRPLKCETAEEARSVLAQLSQAQEMQLLLPVLDLAQKHPSDLRIMLWEHDGFTVHLRRADRKAATKRRIIEAVNERCKELGYPTELVEK